LDFISQLLGEFLVVNAKDVLCQYKPVSVDSGEHLVREAGHYFPGNEVLFLNAVDNLVQAMQIGHRIFLRQFSPAGVDIEQLLASMNSDSSDSEDFQQYHGAVRISGGVHDLYSDEKIVPGFPKEILTDALSSDPNLVNLPLPMKEFFEQLVFDDSLFPVLPNCRGVYPLEVNLIDDPTDPFIMSIRDDEQAGSHFTAIKRANGQFITRRFDHMFKPELDTIGSYITQSANILRLLASRTDNPPLRGFAEYLTAAHEASTRLEGDYPYSQSELAMIDCYGSGHLPLFFHQAFSSTYPDEFTLKKFLSGDLSIETQECRDILELASGFYDIVSLEQNIPYQDAVRSDPPPVPVIIQDVILRSGGIFIGGQGIAVTYTPDDRKILDQHGTVIAAWRNLIDEKVRSIALPIAQVIIPDNIQSQYSNFEHLLSVAMIVGTLSHEQRHIIGREPDPKELSYKLAGYDHPFGEGRAESGRLFSYDDVVRNGLGSLSREDVVRFFEDTYFVEMFRHMWMGQNNPYGKSADPRFGFLVEDGGGGISVDLKVRIADRPKFERAKTALYRLHLDVTCNGNRELQ